MTTLQTSNVDQEIRDSVRLLLNQFEKKTGWGIELIAEGLTREAGKHIHPRKVYRFQEVNGTPITLEESIYLTNFTENDLVLKLFAHLCNHVCFAFPKVTNPKTKYQRDELILAIKECSEAFSATALAIEDGVVDDEEFRVVKKEIMEAIEQLYRTLWSLGEYREGEVWMG